MQQVDEFQKHYAKWKKPDTKDSKIPFIGNSRKGKKKKKIPQNLQWQEVDQNLPEVRAGRSLSAEKQRGIF